MKEFRAISILLNLILVSTHSIAAPTNDDCSICTSYYPSASLDSPRSQWEEKSPLTFHSCAHNVSDPDAEADTSSCCQFSHEFGICGLFWFDSFLYPCDDCQTPLDDPPDAVMTQPNETVYHDCSVCTSYYPSASLDSPRSKWKEKSPLTHHACAHTDPDPNAPAETSGCCQFSSTDGKCGVFWSGFLSILVKTANFPRKMHLMLPRMNP